MRKFLNVLIIFSTVVFVVNVYGGDCLRFRGPQGDGRFAETGLLKKWPEGGPKLVWSVDGLGKGYSSAVVSDGTIYVTGMDEKNQGYLFAYNPDGTPKWKMAYGEELPQKGPSVAGTRGTPTVNKDRIFVMTGFGRLVIFETSQGRILKTIDLPERFGAEQARFGFAECVLIDGEKVICTPGGPNASLVALNIETGETIWQTKSLSQQSACCSARVINHAGKRQIVTMLADSVVAVNPQTGDSLWQAEHRHRAGVQPNPPLYSEKMVYISSGMGAGSEMLEIADDGMSVESKWKDRTLDCQMQGTVLVDGYIYGAAQSGENGFVCLELKTGKVMWKESLIRQGIVVCADDMLYIYDIDGNVHLVKPNSGAFEQVSKFAVTKGTDEHWAHPTIADGRLYIRHGDTLIAYDIKAGS